jgi:hypothetical protein
MTLEELAAAVREMRDAQKAYFRGPGSTELSRAVECEKAVDAMVREILDGRPLFCKDDE